MSVRPAVRYDKSLRIPPLALVVYPVVMFVFASISIEAGTLLIALAAAWMLWRADRDSGRDNYK